MTRRAAINPTADYCRACEKYPTTGRQIFCRACWSLLDRGWQLKIQIIIGRRFAKIEDLAVADMAAELIKDERRIAQRLKDKQEKWQFRPNAIPPARHGKIG